MGPRIATQPILSHGSISEPDRKGGIHILQGCHIPGCFLRFFFACFECWTGRNVPDRLFDLCRGFTMATVPSQSNQVMPVWIRVSQIFGPVGPVPSDRGEEKVCEKTIGNVTLRPITRIRRPSRRPVSFPSLGFQTQPEPQPPPPPSSAYTMSRVSFSRTPPSAVFSRVRGGAFQAQRTRGVLIFLFRDRSERSGRPPSESGESVLELPHSSYVAHPGTFQSHCAALIILDLDPGRTAPFRDANSEERAPGQTPLRACF